MRRVVYSVESIPSKRDGTKRNGTKKIKLSTINNLDDKARKELAWSLACEAVKKGERYEKDYL